MNDIYKISHNQENDNRPIYFHSHDFYEIYFFVKGNVTYYIENESYTLSKGDILIIPPRKIHRPVIETADQPYDRYVLWIYDTNLAPHSGILRFLQELDRLTGKKNTRRVSFTGAPFHTLTSLFDRLLSCFFSTQELSIYTAESCMIFILDELMHSLRESSPATEDTGDLIRQVIAYINRNLIDAPSLDELSSRFFVSKYYLSHKFKEHTKTTIHQYILMKKINLAKDYLEQGDSPQSVCEKCGFSTYSNFYKTFTRQTGRSPGNYRLSYSVRFQTDI